jgi:DNA invertase Pin-like site-specific DNA recombinase
MKKYIAYYRVSTQKQGEDGLGINAQKNAVLNFVGNKEIIAEYTEVETATKKKKRVEIYKAIELAKKESAVLVVAKLDRLTRDVSFVSALYSSGIEFVCCDNPNANKLTIQLLSVIAENEADMISVRIKSALAVKKENIKNGIYTNKDGSMMKPIAGKYRLGSPQGFGSNQKLGPEAVRKKAKNNKANKQAMAIISEDKKNGYTFQKIADKLNKLEYRTSRGNMFYANTVRLLYLRCED